MATVFQSAAQAKPMSPSTVSHADKHPQISAGLPFARVLSGRSPVYFGRRHPRGFAVGANLWASSRFTRRDRARPPLRPYDPDPQGVLQATARPAPALRASQGAEQ